MLENTNIKQFYPGPILNNTLEITAFLFRDPEQVKVQKTALDESGNAYDEDLTYGTDYEVIKILPNDINIEDANLTASTGQVILKNTVEVAQGEKLTVYRESELIQNVDYPRTGKFPAASHEGALDYLTMQNQEQQDQIDRSLKVPITTSNFNGALPIPEANKALKINSSNTGFEFSEYDPDQAVELSQQYLEAAELAANNAEASQIAAAQSENNAEISQIAAAQSENNAQIWAEGTDTEVQELGGEKSAKGWAEKAAIAALEGLGANKDLSNLNPEGEKHFLNKSQVTNCLLEVPQRIKLTFDNDQGLVLHAGSEVIVPYGKGTPTMQIGDALNGGVISDVQVVGDDNKIFYYITYNSDIVVGKTIGTAGSTYWLYVTPEGTIAGDLAEDIYSQAAQPTGISESVIWYDTTNNYVKVTLNTGSSWTQGNSLLIGRLNRTGTGTITSIRDIYNGVGVIGSNFWVDKDVVYCTPAGRNPDGSLKNNIGKINNFTIYSSSVSGSQRFLFLNPFESQNSSANNQGVFWDVTNYFISEDMLYQKRATASGSQYGILYRPSENLFYWSSTQNPNWTVFPEGLVFLGILAHDSTRGNDSDGYPVIYFGVRQALPFKALNYHDRLYIGNLSSIGGFHSVTFGASGTQYIAPFDGWFYAQKISGTSGKYIQCINETKQFSDESKAWDSGSTLTASVPVSNGDLCILNYTATGGRAYLRFYRTNAYIQ